MNFDPTRAANTARELAAFSQDNQILFFTCRPEQAQLLMEAGRAAHAAGAIQAGQNGQAGQSGQAGQTGEVAPAASGVYGQAGGVPAPVLYTVRQGDIRPALDV